MHELIKGSHTITLYRSADELPVMRYARFQKYLLMEAGVGADLESIGGHFAKLFEFQGLGMLAESQEETKNLYYNFYSILEEIHFPGLAFVCLVHNIDEWQLQDTSEESLKKCLQKLDAIGLTQGDILAYIEDFKKKVHRELMYHCPAYFNDEDTLQFYSNVKAKIAALIAEMEGEDVELRLAQLDRFFAEQAAPHVFDSASMENAAVSLDRNFETLCTILESNGVTGPQHLTTLQFYSRLDYFKRQALENKRIARTENP